MINFNSYTNSVGFAIGINELVTEELNEQIKFINNEAVRKAIYEQTLQLSRVIGCLTGTLAQLQIDKAKQCNLRKYTDEQNNVKLEKNNVKLEKQKKVEINNIIDILK